jgi:hypothetical protein
MPNTVNVVSAFLWYLTGNKIPGRSFERLLPIKIPKSQRRRRFQQGFPVAALENQYKMEKPHAGDVP